MTNTKQSTASARTDEQILALGNDLLFVSIYGKVTDRSMLEFARALLSAQYLKEQSGEHDYLVSKANAFDRIYGDWKDHPSYKRVADDAANSGNASCVANMNAWIGELLFEVEQLKKDIETMSGKYEDRTDTERLDWLVTEECCVESLSLQSGTRYRLYWPDFEEYQSEWFSTPREAIDAAIAMQGGKQG